MNIAQVDPLTLPSLPLDEPSYPKKKNPSTKRKEDK